jgi:coenzyme PQQ precursor peptide PqqA
MEDWNTPTFDEIRMDAELTSYVAERDETPAAEDE